MLEELEIEVLSKFAAVPIQSKPGSVGFDIFYPKTEPELVMPYNSRRRVDTGIVLKLPMKCWVLLAPRSSSSKKSITFSNTVGVIDPSYCGKDDHLLVDITRGPHKSYYAGCFQSVRDAYDTLDLKDSAVHFVADSQKQLHAYVTDPPELLVYRPGEKFAQMIIIPWSQSKLVETTLDEWGVEINRGGFGSTGA